MLKTLPYEDPFIMHFPNAILYRIFELIKLKFGRRVNTTDNPLYTYTRYNDKICYNDNLTAMKHSLKR